MAWQWWQATRTMVAQSATASIVAGREHGNRLNQGVLDKLLWLVGIFEAITKVNANEYHVVTADHQVCLRCSLGWLWNLAGWTIMVMLFGTIVIALLFLGVRVGSWGWVVMRPQERPRGRTVMTQAQTTYTWHRQQPRFTPLPDYAHGCWVVD